MLNRTRDAFNSYCERLATLNGVASAGTKFAVSEPVETRMEELIQESSDFLSRCNSVPVGEIKGQILGLYAGSTIARRTDTSAADRPTTDLHAIADREYECEQTNFDTDIKYATLDLWATQPNFETRLRDLKIRQMGRDRLMIGFHGTSAAATTDPAVSTNLEDVNIGWLQKLRLEKPGNVMTDGAHTAGAELEVRVGVRGSGTTDHDYETIEQLAFDLIHSMLDPWHRDDPNLRVLVGRDLLRDKYLAVLGDQAPTERNAAELMILNKTIAGRPAMTAPFFPPRALAVLPIPPAGSMGDALLSIYWQRGSRRRAIIDNPKRDRIEDYMSVREAYVIEDPGAMALCENIIYPEEGTWTS